MIKKLRTITSGTVAIAAVIALFATGPEVATQQAQAANALTHTLTNGGANSLYEDNG